MKKEITIVCADTRDNKRDVALATLAHCQNIFPCQEAILFTNKQPSKEYNNVSVIANIRSLNEERSYDHFILSSLPSYIKTTHYLIVQTDGYILNPNAWDDSFLKYHYIGAPWEHHPKHYWPPHQPVGPNTSVGNGGFCMRQRVLGMTVQGMFMELSRNKNFKTEHWYPEDCFIARDLRPVLESKGFTFAPEELAKKFSFENKPHMNEFGFHGQLTMKINNVKEIECV